ncbi:olfactory receptor 6N1-like [Latimeria chalumnae]
MESENASSLQTSGFYLLGFTELKNTEYLFIFLFLLYIVTLLGNITLMAVICLVQQLHTPKYIAVFNLAVVDILYNTVRVPQMIHSFLFNSHFIEYEACFSQMFFGHYMGSIESFSLAIMAYDRFVAICYPLHYPSIITNTKMLLIIVICWIALIFPILCLVILASRLSFSASRALPSCFCEHGPISRLACGDISLNTKVDFIVSSIILYGPLTFIIVTYTAIVAAVLKIASTESRKKAFSTCAGHIILVLIFYVPAMVTAMVALTGVKHSLDVRNLNFVLCTTLPPMLNPIIYSLKTEQIKEHLSKAFTFHKIYPILANKH